MVVREGGTGKCMERIMLYPRQCGKLTRWTQARFENVHKAEGKLPGVLPAFCE